jgi:hypothetical protein
LNVETKENSKQWMDTDLRSKPKKVKQMSSISKLMATVIWDRKGVLMMKIMQQWTAITSEVCCRTLKNCVGQAIQNKSSGTLISGIVLLHDNARQHTAARTRTLLKHFNWELFDRPPSSPHLATIDCHLFT